MANFLGSIFCGAVAQAQDNVVNACTSVGKMVEHKVVLTARVAQFVMEQGEALSANVCSQVADVVEKSVVVTAAVTLCVLQFAIEQGEKMSAGKKRSPNHCAGPTMEDLDMLYREAFEGSGIADPSPAESFLMGKRQGHVMALTAKFMVRRAVSACWEAASRYVPTIDSRWVVEGLEKMWAGLSHFQNALR